jgi:hypothetical protein
MKHRKNKWWQEYQDYADRRTMTNEEVAEVCEVTADLLEGHWTQSAWFVYGQDGTQFYCLEGGLAAALGLDVTLMDGDTSVRNVLHDCPVYNAVMDTINEEEPDEWDAVPSWNDYGNRTESEVIDLLRTTAKRVLGVGPDQMEVTA